MFWKVRKGDSYIWKCLYPFVWQVIWKIFSMGKIILRLELLGRKLLKWFWHPCSRLKLAGVFKGDWPWEFLHGLISLRTFCLSGRGGGQDWTKTPGTQVSSEKVWMDEDKSPICLEYKRSRWTNGHVSFFYSSLSYPHFLLPSLLFAYCEASWKDQNLDGVVLW